MNRKRKTYHNKTYRKMKLNINKRNCLVCDRDNGFGGQQKSYNAAGHVLKYLLDNKNLKSGQQIGQQKNQ